MPQRQARIATGSLPRAGKLNSIKPLYGRARKIAVTPHGFEAIVKAYGDPRNFLGEDGWMDANEARAWEQRLGLVKVQFPEPLQLSWGHPGQTVSLMRCHPAAADAFRSVFHTLKTEGLWRELKTYGGCFVPRMQRGSENKWSTHTWGIAVDVDVLNNKLGEEPRLSLAVVQIFEANGFTWGGRWRRPDGQHFQLASGY